MVGIGRAGFGLRVRSESEGFVGLPRTHPLPPPRAALRSRVLAGARAAGNAGPPNAGALVPVPPQRGSRGTTGVRVRQARSSGGALRLDAAIPPCGWPLMEREQAKAADHRLRLSTGGKRKGFV